VVRRGEPAGRVRQVSAHFEFDGSNGKTRWFENGHCNFF
jgi:hypothetical protein